MRAVLMALSLLVAACSAASEGSGGSSPAADAPPAATTDASPPAAEAAAPVAQAQPAPGTSPDGQASATQASGPFTGSWQDCESAPSPDECSRYVLLQQGDRICGTWSYVASGGGYEGRVIARASSATQARRVRVCGRAGSEATTECEAGWDNIDKPLQLCDGKLGDLKGAAGCYASYTRDDGARHAVEALAAEPWMRTCLAGEGDTP